MPSSLLVQSLAKTFPSAEGEVGVLKNVNLSALPGDAIAITGPSGTGKSTLLYIIGLLDHPTSGQVLVGDQNPHTLDVEGQARFRNSTIGFVFQDHFLLPQCTVLENVLIPYKLLENRELLLRSGFRYVDTFFKWYNFCGMVAVK